MLDVVDRLNGEVRDPREPVSAVRFSRRERIASALLAAYRPQRAAENVGYFFDRKVQRPTHLSKMRAAHIAAYNSFAQGVELERLGELVWNNVNRFPKYVCGPAAGTSTLDTTFGVSLVAI